MPDNKRLVNLDAIMPQPVEIEANGKRMTLRADVPMRDAILVLPLMEKLQAVSDSIKSAEDAMAWYDEVEPLVLERATAFIRHTDPAITPDDVKSWLNFDQQRELALLFFHLRLQKSSPLLPAPSDASNASATTETANQTAEMTPPTETADSATDQPQPN